MLFAGWEVVGRGQHFQERGHSFSPYGPTLSLKLDEVLSERTRMI